MLRRATLFVLSDVRSGSTLLDQCLGGHPDVISLGEVHWLAAYVRQDRKLYDPVHPLVCTCGKPVGECPFWMHVAKVLGRPLDSLQLRPAFLTLRSDHGLRTRAKRLLRRFVETVPGAYKYGLVQWLCAAPRLARDSVELLEAIAAASGRPYAVDSSKSPFRFRAIYDHDPDRSRAIVLARDYRAVVHSKMKRGLTLEAAAIGWRRRMMEIATLTRDLPESHVHRLKYESLCEDPRREIGRICAFLGLQFSENMLQRPSDDIHHIGGSPSKFDTSRAAITLDSSYKTVFDPPTLVRLCELVGDEADRWGYADPIPRSPQDMIRRQ